MSSRKEHAIRRGDEVICAADAERVGTVVRVNKHSVVAEFETGRELLGLDGLRWRRVRPRLYGRVRRPCRG